MTIAGDLLDLALGLTRAWTYVYTAGLPSSLRVRRRLEIDADLWELADEVRSAGRSEAAAATEVLLRCVLGTWDDLLWRIDESPRRFLPSPVVWTGALMLVVAIGSAWLVVATRIELPQPAPMMTFVEAPPPPPPPPPPPANLR